MTSSNGLYAAAIKDFFESQYVLSKAFTETTMGCAEEMMGLNIDAVKARIAETTVFMQQLASARDQQERVALTVTRLQGRIENTLTLIRQMTDVVVKAQGKCGDEIQRNIAQARHSLGTMMDKPDRAAPAGFQSASGMMHSAMGNNHNGVLQFNQSAREVSGKMASAANAFSLPAETLGNQVDKK